METDVIGFENVTNTEDSEVVKKKTTGKKCGGFQGMGLSFPVLKGIQKRGYKVPTPIQRKTIPLVLEGRDVVAMARTGSGKTACFLIPMFEKLKTRIAKSGARALILSPTRELALQTLKFIKELGRFTGLQAAVILGGDSMDSQFSAIHGNPDIMVATPGRFMHICVEMDLKLQCVEYVVFDEADRLFEMGFGEQLHEIISRLPQTRQTLLFSATLPKVLVDFAKAGLSDPYLLRLDVESKLPEQLKLAFLCCRSEDKPAALLCLLKHAIKPKSMTVVFAATKHHVEYLHMILEKAEISSTCIYSNLDPAARKINAAKFQTGKVSVLVVTDVAARGMDIPQLDNVINYNFPATAKLFVHRVGRCARAGRSGVAYSLVSNDEYPYLLDLHLFLGRSLTISQPETCDDDFPDGLIGWIPEYLLEEHQSELISWHSTEADLSNMKRVCSNAYKQYIRSRPGASTESVKRVKSINPSKFCTHPLFPLQTEKNETSTVQLLEQMRKYKPRGTIFEIGQSTKSSAYAVMKSTRMKHKSFVENYKRKTEETEKEAEINLQKAGERKPLTESNEDDINETFQHIIAPKRPKNSQNYGPSKKKKRTYVDEEHYIPYKAHDHHTEQGLAVSNFQQEASKAVLDLTADSEETLRLQQTLKRWDRKKKKMVSVDSGTKVKKIRNESGQWIPATYKTKRYEQWKEKTKIDQESADEEEESDHDVKQNKLISLKAFPNTRWGRHNMKLQNKLKSELKRPEQVLKARILKEKKRQKQKRRSKKPRRR